MNGHVTSHGVCVCGERERERERERILTIRFICTSKDLPCVTIITTSQFFATTVTKNSEEIKL